MGRAGPRDATKSPRSGIPEDRAACKSPQLRAKTTSNTAANSAKLRALEDFTSGRRRLQCAKARSLDTARNRRTDPGPDLAGQRPAA